MLKICALFKIRAGYADRENSMSSVRAPTVISRKFRITILGAESCGKTAFLSCYLPGKFSTKPTLCHAVHKKTVDGMDLEIWEVSGNERYVPLHPIYLGKVDCVIVCIEPNNDISTALQTQLEKIKKHAPKSCLVSIVVTKQDLLKPSQNQETTIIETVQQVANSLQINPKIHFTSAERNEGIAEVFKYILSNFKKILEDELTFSGKSQKNISAEQANFIVAPLQAYSKAIGFRSHRERANTIAIFLFWAVQDSKIDLARFILYKQKYWLESFNQDPLTIGEITEIYEQSCLEKAKDKEKFQSFLFRPSKKDARKDVKNNKSDFYNALSQSEIRLNSTYP